MDWVTGEVDVDAFMLWFYGPAGAGKTAIARTVAERCETQKLLLASFLFFRSDSKRNTMAPLIANISYCVTCIIPEARESINTVIEADPLTLSYSIEAQFAKLVLEPLRLLVDQGHSFPRLIIIDGLDECLDTRAQANLIRLLSSSQARHQFLFKFLIVSRPETHIKSAIAVAGEQSTVSLLELNNDFMPDEDIRRFLTDKLREIKTCHPFRSGIPSSWPTKQQLDNLVYKASGQFIYSSLAVRFINSSCDSPTRQLDIVLELRPPINHDLPFAELDTLYAFILSRTKNIDLVQRILGVNDALIKSDAFENNVEKIESMLGLEDGDARIYLSPLNSLLEVREFCDNHRIVFHHSSFMDFLRTPQRSTDYCINGPKSHSLIARWMLKVLTSDGMCPQDSLIQNNSSAATYVTCIGPSTTEQVIDEWWFKHLDLASHLKHSSWTPELEHALERFPLPTYLDRLDHNYINDQDSFVDGEFPEKFLNYLEDQVSISRSRTRSQLQLLMLDFDQGKYGLYHHHCMGYLEHITSSMNSPPSREKFNLMSTVWFVLQEPFKSLERDVKPGSWDRLCVTLFGFNHGEIEWDFRHGHLLRDPKEYKDVGGTEQVKYGHLTETKRLIPEPILSHRLSRVVIACTRYLHRSGPNSPAAPNNLLAWATKSKRSPWLWRQRMRVISFGGQQPTLGSLPRSLRRSYQALYSDVIQSDNFYDEQQTFYVWTLDLLCHALRKARKSDELTTALSKSFIPSVAHILFPRRIKRVRKAVEAYLEKVSRRLCLDLKV